MDNRNSNELRIAIAPPHRTLIDSLTKTVEEGKRAESVLLLVVQGILQMGGAANGVQYGRSDDGMFMVPSHVTLTSQQLQYMAAQQAKEQISD